jgi:IS30 family transposase
MKNLKVQERLAVQYFLKGYTKVEVAKMFNKSYAYIPNIVKKINANFLSDKFSKPVIKKPVKKKIIINDLVFVREKVSNFEKVFIKKKGESLENDRKIKMYSLYLQGVPGKKIALMLNKSYHQIGQEIFRINQKIKKYESESLSIS